MLLDPSCIAHCWMGFVFWVFTENVSSMIKSSLSIKTQPNSPGQACRHPSRLITPWSPLAARYRHVDMYIYIYHNVYLYIYIYIFYIYMFIECCTYCTHCTYCIHIPHTKDKTISGSSSSLALAHTVYIFQWTKQWIQTRGIMVPMSRHGKLCRSNLKSWCRCVTKIWARPGTL